MKIKSVAAVGAMGLGLGFASFIGGTGTASAGPGTCPPPDPTPTTPISQRASCLAQNYTNSFLTSTSPAYNAQVLIYGTQETVCTEDEGPGGTPGCHVEYSGLGLQDQPATFVQSVQDFLSGPVGPDGPPTAADPHPPGATEGPLGP
jgi:hypothetical protein